MLAAAIINNDIIIIINIAIVYLMFSYFEHRVFLNICILGISSVVLLFPS